MADTICMACHAAECARDRVGFPSDKMLAFAWCLGFVTAIDAGETEGDVPVCVEHAKDVAMIRKQMRAMRARVDADAGAGAS